MTATDARSVSETSVRSPSLLNGAVLANPAIGGPLLVSVSGWVVLILWSRAEGGLALCTTPGPSASFMTSVREQMYLAPPVRQIAEWGVMSMAMMAPLALPALAQLAARCYRTLRLPAILLALAGYLAVWCVIGLPAIVLTVAARAVGSTLDRPVVVALMAGMAALAWCWTRIRIKAQRRCHVVPAPCGSPTRIVAVSGLFGMRLGLTCIAICGPAMLALSIAGAGLPLMLAMTHILLAERLVPDPRPARSGLGIGIVLLAALIGSIPTA